MIRSNTTAAILLAGALTIAACGTTDPTVEPPDPTAASTSEPAATGTATATDAAAFPATITDGLGNEVTVDEAPQRIVSLSATATEMLFAIGAGDQVEAVDSTSDFPPAAPTTDLAAYEPNVEAIAAHDPDLVVIGYDPGDLAEGLGQLDVPVVFFDAPSELAGSYTQMEALGAVTGNVDGAAEAVDELRTQIEAAVADAPEADLSYYHELDDTYYTVTSSTLLGDVYGLFGLDNIADAADPEGKAAGYPQLSAEHIVEADPDLIFHDDCCGVTLETISARPGWSEITAIEHGDVISLDADIASRWGPRIVELVETVGEAVAGAAG